MSDETSEQEQEPEEPDWTYKGYRFKSSEFVSAIAHEFRAETQHTNVWRRRMEATTHWALVKTGASTSTAFRQPKVHHGVIILNVLLITLFLFIEARRYRFYELWNYRVRLLDLLYHHGRLVRQISVISCSCDGFERVYYPGGHWPSSRASRGQL